MKLSGKKIVELSENERATLKAAADIMSELEDEIGSDDYYDFASLMTILDSIQYHGPFEIDFEDLG